MPRTDAEMERDLERALAAIMALTTRLVKSSNISDSCHKEQKQEEWGKEIRTLEAKRMRGKRFEL